jgi:cell wall-associated NlpC family hydrolase
MPTIPTNAKAGDFFLVSFDGAKPDLSDPEHWLTHGGLIRIGQMLDGGGFAQYEHAAIYIGDGQIIQAGSKGVNQAKVSDYAKNDTFWSTGIINPTDGQRAAIVKAAIGYKGVPYSWVDYAALAAHHLNMVPADTELKDYVSSSNHMICSQVVDKCYADAGVHLFTDNRWPGYVTPADLYNLLVSIKAK